MGTERILGGNQFSHLHFSNLEGHVKCPLYIYAYYNQVAHPMNLDKLEVGYNIGYQKPFGISLCKKRTCTIEDFYIYTRGAFCIPNPFIGNRNAFSPRENSSFSFNF